MTAHKNSRNTIASRWQNNAVFVSLLFMLASLYVSRAALSISLIAFLLLTIVNRNILDQLKNSLTSPFFVGLQLLFIIPFVSVLWSDDINKWSDVIRIKLPLLFLPLAFSGNWNLSGKRWLTIAVSFLLTVFGGCLFGLIDYLQNSAAIHDEYLKAKTIFTPLEDDHVRFSWLVNVAVILCLLLMEAVSRKQEKFGLIVLTAFFISYLHILSARTGLLSLYLSLFIYAVWLLFKSRKRKWSLILLAAVLVLPIVAYFLLPTFKARIQYNRYDLSFAQKEQYLPGSSDGARTMSLRAGWQVLKQNALGVGAGDVMKEADKWYEVNVPGILAADKFYPSSEWLMYGAFAGWPGVILFTIIMFIPFFAKPERGIITWTAFHATAAFSFAFDMGLEVQYGVFLYAFVSCWLWKWLNIPRSSPP